MADTTEVLNDSLAGNPHKPYGRSPISEALQNVSPTRKAWAKELQDYDFMSFSVNLNDYTDAERDNVIDFYNVMHGGVNTWLWLDFGHSAVARQNIGTGDGVEDEFQLIETLTVGGTTRDINRYDIVAASVSVWVATVLKTEGVHYNVNYTTGLVTFTGGNIPGAVAVEAAFTYYRRCIFPEKNGYSESYTEAGLISLRLAFSEVLA